MTTKSTPVSQPERINSVDVLRGFALLGILMMNIQAFGMVGAKYTNPNVDGALQGASYWAWWVSHVLFDSKFMTLFSMLFGAGIVLMWQRAQAANRAFTGLHYRRMLWLMLFGILHAYLLWAGDILFMYSVCGGIVYWFCGLKPRWLIPLGIFMVGIGSLISLGSGCSVPYWSQDQVAEMQAEWAPSADMVQDELEIYRGGWFGQLPHRAENAIYMQTFVLAIWGFWRAGGLMLIGMGLFQLGLFNAARSKAFYVSGAIVGLATGIGTIAYGVRQMEASNWSFEYSFFIGSQFNYWGSLLVSFGYLCLVMLWCQSDRLGRLKNSLACVGQMALTNYLSHSIICTTLFYGHGFGWFGHLDRPQLMLVVIAIWILQLILSTMWMGRFNYGPFEWLWRSLSYWRIQAISRPQSMSKE